MSFRGPVILVVVFGVGRHSCRSFTTSWQTHGGVSLRSPGTLLTFSGIAAPGPDVLLARPGLGSKLLSVNRVTEQAELPILKPLWEIGSTTVEPRSSRVCV